MAKALQLAKQGLRLTEDTLERLEFVNWMGGEAKNSLKNAHQ